MSAPPDPAPAEHDSTADLIRRLSEQTSLLVRQELELARAELTAKGRAAGIGAGLFGGAGALGFYTLGVFIAAVILLLATAVTAWLAATIVFVVLGAIAGILALMGKSKVADATPAAPQATIQTTKDDVEAIKTHARNGRSQS